MLPGRCKRDRQGLAQRLRGRGTLANEALQPELMEPRESSTEGGRGTHDKPCFAEGTAKALYRRRPKPVSLTEASVRPRTLHTLPEHPKPKP